MKLSLSENISRLRRERTMTQEQLAEALGVTFAAVSKWERGAATPELRLIAEMADLFEVSIDALIGYEFRNNDRESTIAKLKQYVHDRNDASAIADAERRCAAIRIALISSITVHESTACAGFVRRKMNIQSARLRSIAMPAI